MAVSRTAAEIAAQSDAKVSFRRIMILSEQRLYRHDEAWSAKTALCSAPIAVGLLNRGQATVLAHSFNGGDFQPFAARCQQRAGHHRHTIDQHRTGSAR